MLDISKYDTFFNKQEQAFNEPFPYYFACDTTDTGAKGYKGFDSLDSVFFAVSTLPQKDRNFYYMMTGEWLEFYDIDGKWTDEQFSGKTVNDIKKDFLHVRKLFLNENLFTITENDELNELYIWETACDDEKVSLHLLVRNGFKFRNCLELKAFTRKFRDFYTENNYLVKFDKAIYTNNRCIRLLGNCKKGSNRVLKTDDVVDMKLHCANYFTGDERFVEKMDRSPMISEPLKISEKKIDKFSLKEQEKAIENKQAVADGDVEKLVELILESIENEEHSLCDDEIPNRMCYDDFKSLAFAVIRVKEGKCKKLFFEIYNYYRNNGDYKRDDMYNNMRKYINYGWGLGSLHYWARENPRYDEEFAETSLLRNYLRLKKKFERQFAEQESAEYNNYADFEQFLGGKVCSLKAVQKWAKANIIEVFNGGKRPFYITRNLVYDNELGIEVEKYITNIEYINIRKEIKIFYTDFLEQQEWFESLTEAQQNALIKKNKQPKMIDGCYIAAPTDDVVNNMLIKNEIPTARFVVMAPYLRTEPEHAKMNFNLFRGFQMAKDNAFFDQGISNFENSITYNHLKNYLCPGDDVFNYVMNYIAHMIQKPDELPGTAILWYSKPGCGKDLILGTMIAKMIGYAYCVNFGEIGDFLGHFTSDQNGKLLTILNEVAEGSSDNMMFKKANVVKDKITRIQTKVELKGVDPYWVKHLSRYFAFTNHERSIACENGDRRYILIECNNDMNGNHPYFDSIAAEGEDLDFIKSMFSYFAHRDISNYQPKNIVDTNFKKQNRLLNIDNVHRFIITMFDEYELEDEFFIHQEDLWELWKYYRAQKNFGILKQTTFVERLKRVLTRVAKKPYNKEEIHRNGMLVRIFNIINTQGYQEKLICDGLGNKKGFYIKKNEIHNFFKGEFKVNNLEL